MNELSIAVALVRNRKMSGIRWLARQNANSGHLHFIVGERLEDESFREAAAREVAWELNLDRKRDFIVSNMAQVNLEFIDEIPGYAGEVKVKVSFYNVEIYRRQVHEIIRSDRRNFWVTSEEICRGISVGGRQFDPLLTYLINRSNVIQSWESQSE